MAFIVGGNINDKDYKPPAPPVKEALTLDEIRKQAREVANLQAKRAENVQSAPTKAPERKARSPLYERPNKTYVRSEPRRPRGKDEHLLVVEGKEKKIGKQSQYLLDMLTID